VITYGAALTAVHSDWTCVLGTGDGIVGAVLDDADELRTILRPGRLRVNVNRR
jgi:hypothetical protein